MLAGICSGGRLSSGETTGAAAEEEEAARFGAGQRRGRAGAASASLLVSLAVGRAASAS